jgi:hypothetical protein
VVERTPRARRDEEGGLLSDERTLERLYTLTLKSFSDQPLRVELIENIPISEVDDIKVALHPQISKGSEVNPDTGFLSWKVKVPAMGEVERLFGYRVSLPEGWKVR